MLDVKYSSACGGSVGVGAGSSNSTKGAGNSKDNDNSGQQPPITLAEEQVLMKRFARPNNQIKGLVNMINATADELDL